jgi:putative methionine-R-sulfoxide reductase with GAF domain
MNARITSILVFMIANHLFCGAGLCQEFDPSDYTRYTRLNGLSNNFVSGIVQDSSGYIWVSTHKGLNKFNGKTFESIYTSTSRTPLPDNLITSMHFRQPNELLCATRAGGFSLRPGEGSSRQFIVPSDSSIYFWANHLVDIAADKSGHYIVSSKTGMFVFDSTATIINRYDYYKPDDAGKVELQFGGRLVPMSDGSTLQQNSTLAAVYNPLSNTFDETFFRHTPLINDIIVDSTGMHRTHFFVPNSFLVVNNELNSIDVVDMVTSEVYSNVMPFKLIRDIGAASKLIMLTDTTFVLTCVNSGFYVLNVDKTTHAISCDGERRFEGHSCTTIFRDRDHRLWVGTADGIFKENVHNSFFSVDDLSATIPYVIDHEIRAVFIDSSFMYVGLQNEGGVLVLNRKTGTLRQLVKFTADKEYSNSVTDIIPLNTDTLWIGTNRGIVWLSKKNLTYGHLVVPKTLEWMQQARTRTFLADSREGIWIAFGKLNSLVRYSKARYTFTDVSPPRSPLLKITFVFSMAEDRDGNIWIAGDGLCRWNVAKQEIDTLIPFPHVSKLRLNYMMILGIDAENNLWLSSYENEIIQYNCSTNQMYLRVGENSLIDGNTVTSSPIIDDHIWLGTDNGISAFNIRNYSVRQFTYADGLPSVAITSVRRGSYYDKFSKRFYIGAKHRLYSFVPNVELTEMSSPKLFIEKILLRDSAILPVPGYLELSHNQDNVTVVFNSINYTDPEEIRFSWRLLNSADTAWSELREQAALTLTNLSAGKHTLQIRLFSANNRWPQQVKTVSFHVHPAFWNTAWFVLLMIAALLLLIVATFKIRVYTIRKHEREKALVQELLAEEYKNRLELEQISNYFSSCIADKKNTADVLWDITRNLISKLDYEDCIVYVWNHDKTKMVQEAAHGAKGDRKLIELNRFEVSPGQGIVGHVINTKQAIIVSDTRKDSRYRVDDERRNSEICVPIIHDNELIGIIDSEHHQANYYKDKDIKILSSIAAQVAFKIKQIESDKLLAVKQKEISLMNQQLAEAQLSALQTQMNPHFIFNSLNSIKGMILLSEQEKASRYLSKFANMIRTTLSQSKQTFTTLQENLEHLDNYLSMEKLRFDSSFNTTCVVGENIDVNEMVIPTMMLQPLAENAIWHGLMHKQGEKKLLIEFSASGNTLCCAIQDNGIGIKASQENKSFKASLYPSVGLNNLRNRIKILNEKYNFNCVLEIQDLNDKDPASFGTRVTLRFNILNNIRI